MSKNFWGLQVYFFINLKVASKKLHQVTLFHTTDETEKPITAINNLGFAERKLNEALDKCHHLGKAKDGKQSAIIRSKSHSF